MRIPARKIISFSIFCLQISVPQLHLSSFGKKFHAFDKF